LQLLTSPVPSPLDRLAGMVFMEAPCQAIPNHHPVIVPDKEHPACNSLFRLGIYSIPSPCFPNPEATESFEFPCQESSVAMELPKTIDELNHQNTVVKEIVKKKGDAVMAE